MQTAKISNSCSKKPHDRATSYLDTWNHMPSNFRQKHGSDLQTTEGGDRRTKVPNERFLKAKSKALAHVSDGCTGEQRMLECARFCVEVWSSVLTFKNRGVLWQSTLEWWVLKGWTLQCWWSDGRVGWRWWTNLTCILFTTVRQWPSLTPITPPPASFYFLFSFSILTIVHWKVHNIWLYRPHTQCVLLEQ